MRRQVGTYLEHVPTGAPSCDLYGFGMVYLPGKLLRGFEDQFRAELDDGSIRFDDTGFSAWATLMQGPASIDWTVHPVHLHYRISQVIR
jgi:hypothetical protein